MTFVLAGNLWQQSVRFGWQLLSEVLALSLAGLMAGLAVPNTTGRVIMIASACAAKWQRCFSPDSSHGSGGDARLAREDVNWITWLPGSAGRHARSRRGIDCPAAFIHDAVSRH
jgi:hypothetical protein